MDLLSQIEAARRSLLDLTMRNRLLNFRPNKKRSIRVVDELPNEVYEIIVVNEKLMQFKHRDKPANELFSEVENGTAESSTLEKDRDREGDQLSTIWTLSSRRETVDNRYTDKYLQTNLDEETLHKRLFYINQQARSVFEEQGYSVLFLALGFLEWKESPDASELRKAPLVLVPVELERSGVQKAFHLKWTSEEVFFNISLSEKLKDLGVFLPDFQMPEDKDGMEDFLEQVSEAIQKMEGWRVLNDIFLDFFSFTKFVMYKDLDLKSWGTENPITDNALIKAVLDQLPVETETSGFSPDEMDQRLAMKDLYHIMDADPYQVAVLEDIKSGRNLVVEGPPGTGKSQTIANAIAELLALGKTVLFVSEKMAALEVVKNRLDGAGLGQYCLEVHSRKASKKDVLRELERSTLDLPIRSTHKGDGLDEIEVLRSELNEYSRALREPIGKIQRSPFALFQMKESATRDFEKLGLSNLRVTWEQIKTYGRVEWNQAVSSLRDLKEAAILVVPVIKNAWYGTKPGLILPSDEDEIEGKLDLCLESLLEMNSLLDSLAVRVGITRLQTSSGIGRMLNAAELIANGPLIERSVLSNAEWDSPNATAKTLIEEVARYQSKLAEILAQFRIEALSVDVAQLLAQYRNGHKRIGRFFSRRWWRLVDQIYSLYKQKTRRNPKVLITSLESLAELMDARKKLKSKDALGLSLFGSLWKAEKSKPQDLLAFSNWIVRFRSTVNERITTEKAFEFLSTPRSDLTVRDMVKTTHFSFDNFLALRDGLAKRINLDFTRSFGSEESNVDLKTYESRLLTLKESMKDLRKWSQYINFCEATRSTIGSPIVDLLDLGQVGPDMILPCFYSNFADNLLREAFKERPSLATFIGELHEKKINRFRDLDSLIIRSNRTRLAEVLEKRRPQVVGGASKGTEVGILLGEFGRKRGHMPIRKLIKQCGRLIQRLKPCFMMSPLSIAQFLDPRSISFDVILFDEASQVRPQDALGALLRGRQLVVMGDTRQLPPTSFFDTIVAGGDEDDLESAEAVVSDVESILHQCKRSFSTKLLSWHYRSRHESLIAVSNREFYDNRLLIFPSAIDKPDTLGLHFVHLPNGVYDRGRSSTNRLEAREVAKAAVAHYRTAPDKSVGVGTFNIRQQQAILEEIELQLIENPEMQEYFNSNRTEHFFVKNLETIQGDERDVILISVGFGFDENKKLSLNFGPLNQMGGERRLNVLITRAREKCVVFANFRGSDLPIDSSSPFGLRALKSFLEFAENRTFPVELSLAEESDSPFEDSVFDFLREHGYEVRKQVGCASFRIDLAIVDPESPGRYMVGIECDGQKYHSSPVARDRDRLRQQILEGLGWNIIRIWSTDWYRNRAEGQQKLLSAIEGRRKDRAEIPRAQKVGERENSRASASSTDHPTSIIGDKNNCNRPVLLDFVENYKCCTSLHPLKTTGSLHAQSMNKLSIAVVRVVDIEGPVHIEEVIKRIRTLWGPSRTGERIREAVENGISYAVKNRLVVKKGRFLFAVEDKPIVARRREGDPPPDLDLISDDEIMVGIKLALKHLFSSLFDDLVVQTSRVFGIQATHEENSKRIGRIIKSLLQNGELVQLSNGMIKLKSDNQ